LDLILLFQLFFRHGFLLRSFLGQSFLGKRFRCGFSLGCSV
jgi:hypothetical protein